MKTNQILCAVTFGAVALLAASCGKDSPETPGGGGQPDVPKDTVIYAYGQEIIPGKDYYKAVVWKDGKKFVLSDGSCDSFVNAGCTEDGEVYFVGCEASGDLVDDGYYDPYNVNRAVVWKASVGELANASKTYISDGKYATSPIAVAVSGGKVYAAGFDSPDYDRRAIVWNDGVPQYLTDGSTDALAYCICIDGDDVYVGGYVQPASNKNGGVATIWKNGVAQNLTEGSTVAKVNAVCVDGGKVYAAGVEKVSGGRWKGVLWIDGKAQDFTAEDGTEVSGLYVKDGKYVISGNKSADGTASTISVYVWTNEGETRLTTDGLIQGSGLAVVGDDVYVTGNKFVGYDDNYNDLYNGCLWKNGEQQSLEVSADNYSLWGVTYALVDKPEQSNQ